jgi:hypothetical protein
VAHRKTSKDLIVTEEGRWKIERAVRAPSRFLGERSGEKSLLNTAFSPLFLKGLARKTLNQPAELFLTGN